MAITKIVALAKQFLAETHSTATSDEIYQMRMELTKLSQGPKFAIRSYTPASYTRPTRFEDEEMTPLLLAYEAWIIAHIVPVAPPARAVARPPAAAVSPPARAAAIERPPAAAVSPPAPAAAIERPQAVEPVVSIEQREAEARIQNASNAIALAKAAQMEAEAGTAREKARKAEVEKLAAKDEADAAVAETEAAREAAREKAREKARKDEAEILAAKAEADAAEARRTKVVEVTARQAAEEAKKEEAVAPVNNKRKRDAEEEETTNQLGALSLRGPAPAKRSVIIGILQSVGPACVDIIKKAGL
jgi:hypothetical protein